MTITLTRVRAPARFRFIGASWGASVMTKYRPVNLKALFMDLFITEAIETGYRTAEFYRVNGKITFTQEAVAEAIGET